MDLVKPKENAHYVTIVADGGYTASLPIKDLMGKATLLAYRLNDKPLEPAHGGPLRLVVPNKYAYKSAKWVRKQVHGKTRIRILGKTRIQQLS